MIEVEHRVGVGASRSSPGTPHGIAAAAAPEDPLAIRLLAPSTMSELPEQLMDLPGGVVVQDLAVSRDGRFLGASLGHLAIRGQTEGGVDRAFVQVWELSTNLRAGPRIDPPLAYTRLALSDDGATVSTSNPVAAYKVWACRRVKPTTPRPEAGGPGPIT